MTIEKTIEHGEKKVKEMAKQKEAERIKSLSPEQKKADEAKIAKEKIAADHKVILDTPEDKLNDEQKVKKAAFLKVKEETRVADEKSLLEKNEGDLSDEEREKKAVLVKKSDSSKEEEKQRKIQQRIDEVTSNLKSEKHARIKDQERIKKLEDDLVKAKGDKNLGKEDLAKIERERIGKHLSEDAHLPIKQRREISDEELGEWMAEDMVGAHSWMADRAVRRDKDRIADSDGIKSKMTDAEASKKAEAVLEAQQASNAIVHAKHPELAVNAKSRIAQLVATGKTEAEAKTEFFKENPKMAVVAEIIEKDDKYMYLADGPEQLMAEMEKRMKTPEKKKSSTEETQEERDQRIADDAVTAERARVDSIDEGLESTTGKGETEKLSELDKAQWEVYQKSFPKKNFSDFKAMKARRKARAGE